MLVWLERIVTVIAVITAVEVIGFCLVGKGRALTSEEMESLKKQISETSGKGSFDLQAKLREEGWDKYLKGTAASRVMVKRGSPRERGPAGAKGVPGKGQNGKPGKGKGKGSEKEDPEEEAYDETGFEVTASAEDWEWRDFPVELRDAVIPDLRSGIQVLSQAGSALIDMPDGSKAFQITGITQGSIIESAGFLPGDVLISVNGERVSGNQDAMRLYNQFRNETRFVVEIERNGQRRTLFYNLQ